MSYLRTALLVPVAALALLVLGCGAGSSAAPKVEGKPRPDWKNMSKEEKIATIQQQSIPPQAKQDAINRINQGID